MNKLKYIPFLSHLHRYKDKIKETIHRLDVRKTTFALLLTVPYFLSEWGARAFGLYATHPLIDNVVHASFGLAFAAVSLLIYDGNMRFATFWTFILSVLWEIAEIIGDGFIPQSSAMLDIFFFDGVKDILVASISAFIASIILTVIIKKYFKTGKQP